MQTTSSRTEADRGFDAVEESRKWKEAVAQATAGMSMSQRVAWLRRQSSVPAISGKGITEAAAHA